MTADKLTPEELAYLRKRAKETGRMLAVMKAVYRRFTSPGVALIGDEVIGDGEAEYFGFTPLKRWPPPGMKPPIK